MKKTIAIILSVLMIIPMFAVMSSAADGNQLVRSYDEAENGQLLYDVVFNAKEGAYVPEVFDNRGPSITSTTDNGKTLVVKNTGKAGAFFYGGRISGLTLGADKSYTITGKVNMQSGNGGIFFSITSEGSALASKHCYGIYGGNPTAKVMSLQKGTGKTTGEKCDGKNYITYDITPLYDKSEENLADIMIVVEGYTYSVYLGGELFDKHVGTAEEFAGADSLGLSLYVYDKNTMFTMKDFKVWKGNILSSAPEATDEKLISSEYAKKYNDAKDGQLIYDVVFNAKTGVYVPTVFDNRGSCDVTTQNDGNTLVVQSGTEKDGAFFYGGRFEGLKVEAGSTYTITGKIKIDGGNAGIYFSNTSEGSALLNKHCFGFYGGNTKGMHMTLGRGTGKTTGEKCDGTNYLIFDLNPAYAQNADGYADVMIIVDGYNYSVYFGGELFDTHIGTAEEFSGGDALGLSLYVYNKNTTLTMKDFQLWKGNKLTAQPEETEPPVETTEPPVETTEAPVETTEAPIETTEPTLETTEAPAGTTEPSTSGPTGDNSVYFAFLAISVIAIACAAVFGKRIKE